MNTDARRVLMRAVGSRPHRPEDVSLEELRTECERFPDYYNAAATPADTLSFNPTDKTMSQFNNVSVVAKANVYFDGKCVSHTLQLADGSKKSVGVILPSALVFNTGAAEIMECVAGACRYRLKGEDWKASAAGESFSIPANSSFDIEVTGEPYHYVCHFA